MRPVGGEQSFSVREVCFDFWREALATRWPRLQAKCRASRGDLPMCHKRRYSLCHFEIGYSGKSLEIKSQ